mgnify:CR=1 FL=1
MTPMPEGELRKQGPPRRHTLGCMGSRANADDQRMPLLRNLHRRLLMLHMDLPDEEEERSALPLPKAQELSGERNGSA